MKLYDGFQLLIVASAILFSAMYALGRIAPNLRKRSAAWLQQAQQPSWLKIIGASIGAKISDGSAGCGDGCSTCGSCTPKNNEAVLAIKIIDDAPIRNS